MKRRKTPKLSIFSNSSQVKLYKKKIGTKEKKLRNDAMKLYLKNHEKKRISWLIFGEDKKKEARCKY